MLPDGGRQNGLGQRLDGGSQAALVASGLVLVVDVLVSHAIDHAAGFLEHFTGRRLVADRGGLAYALDRGAQHRAQAGIMLVAIDRLRSKERRAGKEVFSTFRSRW